ncbi:protein transport protein SEC31 [Helicoverpa armigera]|uniref:protein transport protein SEC31 n=1 Tax=Helicoverpa armigera TaxID=29058 RepID=UPI00308367D7
MKGIQLVVVLGAVAISYGFPTNDQGKNLITGVFIPSDAFKNLQDRANANSPNNGQQVQGTVQNQQPNYQPVTNGVQQPTYQPINTNAVQQPNYQPVNTNQPQYQQYQPQPVMTNQPPTLNQQPIQNQQPIVNNPQMNNQPVLTNQPNMNQPGSNMQPMSNQPNVIYTQQPLTANRDPNQQIMVMTNQPNGQSNQPIVLVQQPSSNQPMYVQQPNQPQQVIIATNPSNGNQIQGTLVQSPNQNQPGSTVYTLIPLNGQTNINSNSGGSYLIPVQSGNSNPIILSTGK